MGNQITTFYSGKHRSEYSDLIRYLPDNGSGRLILPNTKGETDRHHDRGFYICHASNNVSLNGSNCFIRGEFFLKAQGKPYFVTSNNNTQYGIKGQQGNLTYDFVSFPDIENISVIVNDMIRSNENYSIKTMKVIDRVYHKTILVNGSRLMLTVSVKAERDFGSYTIKLYNQFGSAAFTIDLRQFRAPQNLKAVALDTQIIVKWTGNHDIGLQETFFVEYRKHFESIWSRVSAEYKSTAILNGLQPGAVYFLRVFSKTTAGESSKSDVIIVKTALTYKQRSSRNQDIGTLSRRNDETIIIPAHYDEIDSMYYNPINATISHQASRNNVQDCTRQRLKVNLGDWEANNISSRNVHCAVHQFKPCQENTFLSSSSDE
ncbi:unnamed protein product [Mytilus coruscus]|uniref:Fibronectin type-III domain-containing protein n=1 Tax=Mytilus coruscus TaxID=42192 RepID=A0A6J8AIW3_MYTCO|nr:unnamed protein product [Mytilus coruscus]